jgi:hypothetical protein
VVAVNTWAPNPNTRLIDLCTENLQHGEKALRDWLPKTAMMRPQALHHVPLWGASDDTEPFDPKSRRIGRLTGVPVPPETRILIGGEQQGPE